MNHVEDVHPLDLAVKIAGGRGLMAYELGVTVAAVGNWKLRGVPIEKCVAIERMTRGAVTRRDLRPQDWQNIWPELAPAHATPTDTAIETIAEP